MAAGLPVIISDQVGIHHEVTMGNAGLVVAIQVDELAKALEQLVTNPMERQLLGKNGKRLVTETFSQAAMTQRLLAMYDHVLTRGGNNPLISSATV